LGFPCPRKTPDIEPGISPYPGDVGETTNDLFDCDDNEPDDVPL